jgi:Complex 1 protein (LYR family)
MSPSNQLMTRARALSLYRQLLRGAQKMPTPNRQNFIIRKTRAEYRANRNLTDLQEIDFHLRLADTNLDTVLVQAEHLTRLTKDPDYLVDM